VEKRSGNNRLASVVDLEARRRLVRGLLVAVQPGGQERMMEGLALGQEGAAAVTCHRRLLLSVVKTVYASPQDHLDRAEVLLG
jgi:hypothetical protein